jgi:hypothetical protein
MACFLNSVCHVCVLLWYFLVRTVLQEAHECVMQALVISRMMLGEVHPLLAEAYKYVVAKPHTHAYACNASVLS